MASIQQLIENSQYIETIKAIDSINLNEESLSLFEQFILKFYTLQCLLKLGDIRKGIEFSNKFLNDYSEVKLDLFCNIIYFSIVITGFTYESNLNNALNWYSKSKEFVSRNENEFFNSKDNYWYYYYLVTIALVLLKKKEYSISFDTLKQITYHYQDKTNLNRSEMLLLSWVNTLLAQIHKQTNYPDLAINEFRKACEWGIKARNIEYTRSAYIYLALTYEETGKEYIAIEIAEELLEQIEKNFEKDEFSLSSAYNLLGNIFGRLGEFEVAKNNYFKAYNAVTNTILLQRIKSFYLNNLGVIAFKMGNYEEALTYYLQSLELAIQKENPRELSYYYSNIGEVYLSLNQPENALKSELNALNYLNTYQNDDLLLETYFLLVKTYLTQQDLQRAEFYVKELGKLTSSSRKLSYTIKFKIAEALLLKEKHKTILAKEIFLQVLSYFNLTYDSKILALTELAEMVLSEKIEIQREDFEDLEKISQKLLYLAKEKDSPPVISNVSIFLSQILLIGSDYDNAIKLLTETKNYCTLKNALFFRDKIQHELKNIYELKHINQENNINKQSINNYNSEEILNNIRELQRFMLAFAK